MNRAGILIAATFSSLGLPGDEAVAQRGAESFELTTSDGLTVFGELYSPNPAGVPVLLLFHQGGGDGRGEYEPVLPRLLETGYNAIVIDQRRGGDRFDGANRTAAAAGDREFGYCDAYPELESTLEHAQRAFPEAPVVAWGSSYSAALALQLAARHPDEIAAVLAFSPASGEPMDGCRPETYIGDIRAPVLILRPGSEAGHESVAAQLQTFRDAGFETYVAPEGVHGSSMLGEGRTGTSTGATWAVVDAFLAETVGP